MDTERKPLRAAAGVLEMSAGEFRSAGHMLIDRIAAFLETLPARPVTRAETLADLRAVIRSDRPLPDEGRSAANLLDQAADVLFEHSLFNGSPRFLGYVTSSPTPIGALAELLAAAVNPNVGAHILSPAATEIEAQTIRWIADFMGYPTSCGGLLVSGGNMANMVGFLAARAAKAPDIRKNGAAGIDKRLCCYCSTETHTWIQKAADFFGLGTDAIRWIQADGRQRLDLGALKAQVDRDLEQGNQPFLVSGNAGSVSTGASDPLEEIAAFSAEYGLWFHVDGAYGGLAACVPGAPKELSGLALADSVAVDPHKWLYAPLEAGCALVRDPNRLLAAFSYRPAYYHFDTEIINYFDYGPQNSRGFRALKIWLALQQAGRAAYVQTIAEDIELARYAFELFDRHADFEALTHSLSITTFRYVPPELRPGLGSAETESKLDQLNRELLLEIEKSGEVFVSNAVVAGKFVLRLCIVNFRTTRADIEALPEIIGRLGARVFARMREARASASG